MRDTAFKIFKAAKLVFSGKPAEAGNNDKNIHAENWVDERLDVVDLE